MSVNIGLEEVRLVHLGIKREMALIRSGKVKLIPLEKVLAKYGK